MYEEASSYGLRSGITYPIHGPNGEFGVISFVSDTLSGKKSRRILNHQLLASLSMVRDVVFESSLQFLKKPVNTNQQQVRLTSRETECLKWLMEGKSSWEISKILGCSEATIIFHVSNIRSKFQVRTRQQAVVKAIKLGILTPN
jgi:LuxR family quorum-sensing transcriptional regulator LasR